MNESAPQQLAPDTFEEVVNRICDSIQNGEQVDIDGLAASHPEMASQLRSLYPTLLAISSLEPSESGHTLTVAANHPEQNEKLGDFRIIRQIGRGGMGVVYEAQQLSIQRAVAVKVLPLASLVDPAHCSGSRTKLPRLRRWNIRISCRSIPWAKIDACIITPCNSFAVKAWQQSSANCGLAWTRRVP